MIHLDNFLLEKLKISQDIEYYSSKDSIDFFIVLYSNERTSEVEYKVFSDYDNAIKFSKQIYYLDGYCVSYDILKEIEDEFIKNKKWSDLIEFAKNNKLIRLFNYNEKTK